jgi:hypothetical protein
VAADNGDGNGVVAGAYNAGGNVESRNFWLHLRKSGFVAGAGKDQPFNALTGMIGVQTGDGSTPPVAALLDGPGGPGFVGLIMCSANLPDKVAIAVDTQMDDGLAGKGSVRGLAQAAPNPAIGAVEATAAYAETGSNVYTLCRAL